MSKFRVGIIGVGFIGTLKHLEGLGGNADLCDVVAVCDLDIDRANKAKDKFGSADSYVTTDWHDIANDASIDVVYVCTWNVSHCEITCAMLEAGKHVMCEKPMAVTGADARTMARPPSAPARSSRSATRTGCARTPSSCAARSTPANSARSTSPRPTPCVVAASRPGACSPTRRSRAADR